MTNQQGAPEALRPEMLDDLIETFATAGLGRYNLMRVELPRHQWAQLAVALSRLHAENERLAALVEAQQPAPSAAVALSDDLRDRLVAISEAVADQDDRAAQAMLREILKAPQPSPTAQADSVPAPQGETNVQLDIDSNHSAPGQQRDVARSVALGQPVGNGSDQVAGHPSAQGDKLLTVAERNIRSFLRSAVFKSESDREAALSCVDVLRDAARAPAESVTAPAGGVDDAVDAIALARYKVVPAHESMFHRFAVVAGDGKQQLYLGREIECANMARKFAGAFLDGAFYQANIAPTPPAQAADSVLEDAARLAKIMQAIRDYHFALDNREHGGIAMARAWNAICDVLNMDWVQGAETAARERGDKHDRWQDERDDDDTDLPEPDEETPIHTNH